MGKVCRKISSGFRPEERTKDFAVVLCALLSAGKQGHNRFGLCCKGPTSCSPLSLPNGRPPPLARIASGRAPSSTPFSGPGTGQRADQGRYLATSAKGTPLFICHVQSTDRCGTALVSVRAKHQRTLERLFRRPTPSDIRWIDLEARLKAVGVDLRQRAGPRVLLVLGSQRMALHCPHPQPTVGRATLRAAAAFPGAAGIRPD